MIATPVCDAPDRAVHDSAVLDVSRTSVRYTVFVITVEAPTWQPSLFVAPDGPSTTNDPFDPLFSRSHRCDLGDDAWVDFVPGWASCGDELFESLHQSAPWRSDGDRVMYDRLVGVPRLTTGQWNLGRPTELDAMAIALGARYELELPSISANLYRDGSDSVAWHGDRVGLVRATTVVAILSLGSPRTLLVRPDGGGPSVGFTMHSGDLVVMGGTCQRTHEHSVPKRSNAGPRISVMFRERGGN